MTAEVPKKATPSKGSSRSSRGKRAQHIKVRKVQDHVEVIGVSVTDVEEALRLADEISQAQLDVRRSLEGQVNQILLKRAGDLIPSASQRQIQRTADLRERLIAEHGAETYESLAQLRETKPSSVRTWVSRVRERGELFIIKLHGTTLIPRVQLTDDGSLHPAITPLVRSLLQAGLDAWSLWAWLTSPTGLLSGEIPAKVAPMQPARVQKAADRYAAEIERGRGAVA